MVNHPTRGVRSFSIDNLLSIDQTGEGAPEEYVEKLEDNIQHIEKFKIVKSYSKYLIKNIPADPETLLGGIFQYCFDEAVSNAQAKGVKPEMLGCTLTSELLHTDIWIPLRPITENTFNTMLNQFYKVSQSKKSSGVTLWGKPFSVNVMIVDKKI
uniref:Uncharacterized protein n=1 Tax=Meloidogyne enterolobii TaxID=390850 RepID=A0A6V7XJP4_MELEN|nr:unnamed protein product [Meloidogyne enterolobii]